MKNALIISKTEASIKAVTSLLEGEGYDEVQCTLSVEDAKEKLSNNSFELIVINAPLCGENGLEFSAYCSRKTKACIILVVAKEKAIEVFDMMDSYGVLVVSKPLNRKLFKNYITYSAAFKDRLTAAEKENEKLKNELEEIKVINRAKLLLIQCLSMTEAQAHRYLEKQAMNMRTSRLNIAKQVIRTYQN
ncbi:MAG: ANTAR domain-containing protein [Ruminococcus sp.]|nr:ANTAR domain-containing protein [Ruminococcus sp.]